jgi:hypothetical protein
MLAIEPDESSAVRGSSIVDLPKAVIWIGWLHPSPHAPCHRPLSQALVLRHQRADDLLRHVVLHGEYVGQIAIEPLRPKMASRGCVDKLGGDAHPVPRLAYAALKDMPHTKLRAHVLYMEAF